MNKNKLPLVSICIPVFNGSDYIKECIDSVLDQNYTNFELVIVDNNSTDNTESLVKNFKDKRIRYIKNSKNIGGINNFTRCIDLAHGEYFVLLPHDDLLLPDALEEFVRALENKNIGFVYSAMQVINEDGDFLYKKINHANNMSFSSEMAIKDLIINFMPIQCAMVRIGILKKLGGFNISFSLFSDVHLWFSIIFEGWGVYYINTPKSCLRSHPEQAQRAFTNPNLDKLSEHWGKKLNETFWKKNSYNYLQLKLSSFVFDNMKKKRYNASYAKKIFLKMFVRSHIRSILLSIINFNKFALILELSLFNHLRKQYSLTSIFMTYLSIILKEIWVRLFPKTKNSL